ncbi:MAG: phosphoserine phosphatase RsbU/P [Acidobacteriota bacterium]|jgi:hypothetical protein|nr:phosphoserine phosphatase RsbU/P [Acidobacteriota bacterium]
MPSPSFPRALWDRWLRDLLLALLIGLAVGFLVSLGGSSSARLVSLSFGGLSGLGIFLIARLIGWALRKRLEKLTGARRTAAYSLLFFVSGGTAFLIAERIMPLIFPGTRLAAGQGPVFIAITGGLAIAIGLAFASFARMTGRLAASVARIKEVEFAERELQLARDLQSRLLPPPEIEGEGYRVAARNLAARVVAGDFYDVFRLSDGAVGLAVADVAGKGMAASLIMALAKARLPLLAADRPAGETLRELNRALAAELSSREFVALAFARFNPVRGTLALANAGLPDPYLLRKGEPPRALAVPGPRLPLGIRREVAYESLEVTLQPGDRLLLFTDGLAEAPTAAGEPLGYPALAALLTAGDGALPLAWLDGLLDRVRTATTPILEDDWTVLLLERAGDS